MRDEINGFSVIASAIIDTETRLILAEGFRESGPDFRLIYVVSTAPIENTGTGWHSGTYFDGPTTTRNKRDGRAEFARRLAERWS